MGIYEPFDMHIYYWASILKRFALLPRSFHLLCARSSEFHDPIARFVYLGDGESLSYIENTLALCQFELASEKIPLWLASKMTREIPADGSWLCVEINRLLSFARRGGILTFPWLRQRVYLNNEEYRKRRRKIEDNFGRKVRKYQYSFRLVQDASAVEIFYERYYLPHITARFGKAVHARSVGELQRAAKRGFLGQVLCHDRWIAGVICIACKDELSARAFGHLPDNEYPLRLGGLSAAYYYLIQYAAQHSLASVDLMRSRPNAADGVYCHKKRWGAVAEKDLWPHTALWLFPPRDRTIPESLQKLLVWNGRNFVEMHEMIKGLETE
jgi:hypothetical protein